MAPPSEAADPCGLALQTLENLPPPPRSSPLANVALGTHGCGLAGDQDGGQRFVLKVLTSENRWETFTFSASGDQDAQGEVFLQTYGLKSAFKSGLLKKMQSMIALGQMEASIDIVDLI